MTPLATILSRADAGQPVADIAAALDLTVGRIYAVLRQHRPDRCRKERRRVSKVPAKVRALLARGIVPSRVAFLLGITRAYVYRIMADAEGE